MIDFFTWMEALGGGLKKFRVSWAEPTGKTRDVYVTATDEEDARSMVQDRHYTAGKKKDGSPVWRKQTDWGTYNSSPWDKAPNWKHYGQQPEIQQVGSDETEMLRMAKNNAFHHDGESGKLYFIEPEELNALLRSVESGSAGKVSRGGKIGKLLKGLANDPSERWQFDVAEYESRSRREIKQERLQEKPDWKQRLRQYQATYQIVRQNAELMRSPKVAKLMR